MLSVLYTKTHLLYSHHHKTKLQKAEGKNGKKVTLLNLLNERQKYCNEKILYFMSKHTMVKTKVFHRLGQAADPIPWITPVKQINAKFMLPIFPLPQ